MLKQHTKQNSNGATYLGHTHLITCWCSCFFCTLGDDVPEKKREEEGGGRREEGGGRREEGGKREEGRGRRRREERGRRRREERRRKARPMKGTEVPNPRRSSACDCTCVLTRIDHCLVTLSCLPYTFCFVPAYAKFAHKFLMFSHRPCATYL